jgi:hypothetical protein
MPLGQFLEQRMPVFGFMVTNCSFNKQITNMNQKHVPAIAMGWA